MSLEVIENNIKNKLQGIGGNKICTCRCDICRGIGLHKHEKGNYGKIILIKNESNPMD